MLVAEESLQIFAPQWSTSKFPAIFSSRIRPRAVATSISLLLLSIPRMTTTMDRPLITRPAVDVQNSRARTDGRKEERVNKSLAPLVRLLLPSFVPRVQRSNFETCKVRKEDACLAPMKGEAEGRGKQERRWNTHGDSRVINREGVGKKEEEEKEAAAVVDKKRQEWKKQWRIGCGTTDFTTLVIRGFVVQVSCFFLILGREDSFEDYFLDRKVMFHVFRWRNDNNLFLNLSNTCI